VTFQRPALPGPTRTTLVVLLVVTVATAYYRWDSGDRWLLIGAAVVLGALLGWWRGVHFTTILHRRLTLARRSRRARRAEVPTPAADPVADPRSREDQPALR
jgi:hypothetical protein